MEQENDKQKTSVFFDEELEMMPTIGVYAPYLDDDETDGDEVIEEVNIGFKPHLVPVPKTGYIGYVKVESKHYEGPKVEPRLFEMEEHEYEAIR